MGLCRSSRSGYEPFGNDHQEYVAYKFLTRITLCCLAFALCVIIMLYISAYYCTMNHQYPGDMVYDSDIITWKDHKKIKRLKQTHVEIAVLNEPRCSSIPDDEKFDCLPGRSIHEESCRARGCCWERKSEGTPSLSSAPWCYYPKSYGGYKYVNVTRSKNGVRAFLMRTFPSPYPDDVKLLRLDAQYQSSHRLRIRIIDPVVQRYEPPYPEVPLGPDDPPRHPSYKFYIEENKTGFQVSRNNSNVLLVFLVLSIANRNARTGFVLT